MPKKVAYSFIRWMVIALLAGSWIGAYGASGTSSSQFTDRLSRRGTSGYIAVCAGGKHLPENAEAALHGRRNKA